MVKAKRGCHRNVFNDYPLENFSTLGVRESVGVAAAATAQSRSKRGVFFWRGIFFTPFTAFTSTTLIAPLENGARWMGETKTEKADEKKHVHAVIRSFFSRSNGVLFPTRCWNFPKMDSAFGRLRESTFLALFWVSNEKIVGSSLNSPRQFEMAPKFRFIKKNIND